MRALFISFIILVHVPECETDYKEHTRGVANAHECPQAWILLHTWMRLQTIHSSIKYWYEGLHIDVEGGEKIVRRVIS